MTFTPAIIVENHSNVGPIVSGVVGGVAGIAIIAGAAFCGYRSGISRRLHRNALLSQAGDLAPQIAGSPTEQKKKKDARLETDHSIAGHLGVLMWRG